MMRKRKKQKPDLYPRWQHQDSPARQAKERDGKQCVCCQIEDRTLIEDADGKPLYILYLHAAHLHPLDPAYWTTEPIQGQRLRAMCPACHRRYDLYWQRQAEEVEHQRRLHGILRDRCQMSTAWLERRFLEVR